MYIIWGMIRSTILYGIVLSLLSGIDFPLPIIALYVLVALLHIFKCKVLSKDTRGIAEIFSGALVHDVIAPFLSAKMLLERLFRHFVLRDKSEIIFEVEMQVYVKGIWAVCILLLLISKLL